MAKTTKTAVLSSPSDINSNYNIPPSIPPQQGGLGGAFYAMKTLTPFARPLYVMLKPVGPMCNLRCQYCYYLPTANRHNLPYGGRNGGGSSIMSDELLEQFTKEYIEAQTMPQVLFTWHGGEPTLRPLDFYRKAVQLQKRYAQGRQINNCLQTNGTLLNDEWCAFLAENHFLVGLSIDGPQPFHDQYRLSNSGQPTWERVVQAIQLLRKHGVEWNAMATVNKANVDHPLDFYHFFKENQCTYLQFTPIVETLQSSTPQANKPSSFISHPSSLEMHPSSITPQQWGDFLCAIFDEWVRTDVGSIFVEIFDCTLANWVGETPGICAYAKECGHAAVMEADGDVYSCDHFVRAEHHLGNIREKTLVEMLYGPQQQRFSLLKHQALPRQCRECDVEFACHGECPKNRIVNDRYGNPGLNYLCEGYRQFYHHVAPYMDFMARELSMQRPPANVMQAFAR